MTYGKFLERVLAFGIKPLWYIPSDPHKSRWNVTEHGFWYESEYTVDGTIYKKMAEEFVGKKKKVVELPTTPRYIHVTWETGGTHCGGYRDGDDPSPYATGTPEPEFEDLDKILEFFSPTIGFLQYKGIVRECVETEDWIVNEYYGNSTNHVAKYVDLQKLFEVLVKKGLLEK